MNRWLLRENLGTYQQLAEKLLVQAMPLEGRLQVLGHQIQVARNVLQAVCVEGVKVLGESVPGVHVGDIRQREHAERRELAKGCALQ